MPKIERVYLIAAGMWACLFCAVVAASMRYCEGRLIFTLDDPYIHLSVARNLLSGEMGVNAHEASSPCSSIIWPWMLAVTESLGLGFYGPFLLNAFAALATVLVGLRIARRLGLADASVPSWLTHLFTLILILVTSALALPMTGMEHSWHVMTGVVILDGLIAVAQGEAPSVTLLAAIVLAPLLRFEGAAFSLAAVGALWLCGRRGQAGAAAAALALCSAAYALFMRRFDLPLLPSSVLLKSRVSVLAYEGKDGAAFLDSVAANAMDQLSVSKIFLLGCAVVIVHAACSKHAPKKIAIILYAVVAAIVAHLLFGAYGWFYRYEVYVVAIAFFGLFQAAVLLFAQAPAEHRMRWAVLSTVTLGAAVGAQFAQAAALTPAAAQSIYCQQYQMRRFALDYYRMPVGVNDLGLVSYGNPSYVLDLFGLGSEPVRRLKLEGRLDAAEMAALAKQHDVNLIMLYEGWYGKIIPKSWRRVAWLTTPRLTAYFPTVSFFATENADKAKLLAELQAFKATLPRQDFLTLIQR